MKFIACLILTIYYDNFIGFAGFDAIFIKKTLIPKIRYLIQVS